jgi:HrpA-like RNA helicase
MLFLTEGVLLRQLVDDPSLQRYNVVILDEVFLLKKNFFVKKGS